MLKQKGVVLAVCSKNNEGDAREPFERHPEMRLKLADFAAFVANWEPKPDNLRRIAQTLGLGLDALVFVDDNPAECAAVRQALPEVDVLALPQDPSHYARFLFDYLGFESASFTAEDVARTDQYRARAEAVQMEGNVGSIEELWESLAMEASIAPINEVDLPRIVQLIGKTNQFNVTTRRHNQAQVEALARDPACIHFSLRLRDRFADHGLVSLMIAVQRGAMLEIDTWLMSCRVIGRSVERAMLAHLCQQAAGRGVTGIRGKYLPTAKNSLVKTLFPDFGFVRSAKSLQGDLWEYDLTTQPPFTNEYIKV